MNANIICFLLQLLLLSFTRLRVSQKKILYNNIFCLLYYNIIILIFKFNLFF